MSRRLEVGCRPGAGTHLGWENLESEDMTSASLSRLTSSYFVGDVCLRTSGGTLVSPTGLVAVLGFSLELLVLADKAVAGPGCWNYWLKESDHWFTFARQEDSTLNVSANFSDVVLRSSATEFREASYRFYAALVQKLGEDHLELLINPHFAALPRGVSGSAD